MICLNMPLLRLFYLKLFINNKMDNFINVIKNDPNVGIEIEDVLDRYMRLP